eukprot:maker-scaffold_1-snap-gene-25.0-mRNA-1 protein AED:0.22 eAED:0.22 QI:1/1/1/1/1/1/2/109/632
MVMHQCDSKNINRIRMKTSLDVKKSSPVLQQITSLINNTFISSPFIQQDPQNDKRYPNQETRPVHSGHYVHPKPEEFISPFFLAANKHFFNTVNFPYNPDKDIISDFCKLFCGDNATLETLGIQPWATPYAVSVRAHPILSPDQFRGKGYGDGRASYLFQLGDYEVQLKGSGRTPFSRTHDGRAVLRSSIREYLASLSMQQLGVPTTLPVCLITSLAEEDKVLRAWYPDGSEANSKYEFPPNEMRYEKLAIASRATKSFVRIGHLELYARRMRTTNGKEAEVAKTELNGLIDYYRSVHGLDKHENKYFELVKHVGENVSDLVMHWLRVGYVQGNMNSDNILLNGDTMDYGPFGFVEKYNPTFNPFTSDPEKRYSFEQQPKAMYLNLATFVDAVSAVVENEKEMDMILNYVRETFPKMLNSKRRKMLCDKLGLKNSDSVDMELAQEVEGTMYKFLSKFDYTLFFRGLTETGAADVEVVTAKLIDAAYDIIQGDDLEKVRSWVDKWKQLCGGSPDTKLMEKVNPEFIPREWLLVKCYEDALASALFKERVSVAEKDLLMLQFQKFSSHASVAELWYDTDNENRLKGFGKFYALERVFSDKLSKEDYEEAKKIFIQKTPVEDTAKPGTSFYNCSS